MEQSSTIHAPGSPWENGHIESFNGKLRDELLNGEILTTLFGATVLVEDWHQQYNQIRPHRALGYQPQHLKRFCHNKILTS